MRQFVRHLSWPPFFLETGPWDSELQVFKVTVGTFEDDEEEEERARGPLILRSAEPNL